MGEFYEYLKLKISNFIRAIRPFVSFAIVLLNVATLTAQVEIFRTYAVGRQNKAEEGDLWGELPPTPPACGASE
jgi:hypothetical protein